MQKRFAGVSGKRMAASRTNLPLPNEGQQDIFARKQTEELLSKMCLSVYLGSHDQVPFQRVRKGALGIEEANWTPPALSDFPFRYYLGRKGEGDELECSCLLAQHVEWTEHGPRVCFDDLYISEMCPFDDLRGYVNSAQQTGRPVVLACDDSGGSPQECSEDDYDHMVIGPEMITAQSYLFADPMAAFPWRVFHLIAPYAE